MMIRNSRQLLRTFSSSSGAPASFDQLLAKTEAKAPDFASIYTKWEKYPEVQASLTQLQALFEDAKKDHEWTGITKSFKHDANDTSIDWDFAEQHLGSEFVNRERANMEAVDEDGDKAQRDAAEAQFLKEFEKHTRLVSAEIQAQNDKFQAQMPELEKELERTQYLMENIKDLTLEEERAHEPEIFAEIEAEQEEHNWDEFSESMIEEESEKHH